METSEVLDISYEPFTVALIELSMSYRRDFTNDDNTTVVDSIQTHDRQIGKLELRVSSRQ